MNKVFYQIRLKMKLISFLMMMLLASAQGIRQYSIDQVRCHYIYPRCQPSEFNCRCEDDAEGDSRECIPQSCVCDGQRDCLNGADEIDCRCDPGEYQCYDGVGVRLYQCINESRVCNGGRDCMNSRDDVNEKCEGGFQCDNGLYLSSSSYKCDGGNHCGDNSDEDNCDGCPQHQHRCDCYKDGNDTCVDRIRCYKDWYKCDGHILCPDGSDEWNCSSCPSSMPLRCACNEIDNNSCLGAGTVCYAHHEICNGYAVCADGSDEWNCSSCPPSMPLRCACNKINDYSCSKGNSFACYWRNDRCDGETKKTVVEQTCPDSSDEMNCTCPKHKFTCPCFSKNFPTCNMTTGCIPVEYVDDGKFDCPSHGDEYYVISLDKMSCGSCIVDVARLQDEIFCIPPWCDKSTCNNVPSLECTEHYCNMTDAICFSFCSDENTSAGCNEIFQCSDQSFILNQNFCNGREECKDGTDEITFQPGFKCSAKFSTILCVLPQWNLYDDTAQCYDKSDLCFGDDGSFYCFQCLDSRLIISPKQVCDGVIDCFDLSDECLCENPSLPECLDIFSRSSKCGFFKSWNTETDDASGCENLLQVKENFMTCKNKQGDTQAVQCDGRPECIDFSDECKSCPNPPAFCNDTCRTYFPMGDRYCDGYIDEAWKYLQDTNCSKGFDENNCTMRFQCKAGEKVSIDILQQCDGRENCDDGIDENNCFNSHYCTTKVGNLTSIPNSSVLNGKQDCVDGSDEFIPGIFSSTRNMIDSLGLKIWLWFITVLTILGNFYVATMSIETLHEKKSEDASVCNHLLIINLSVSDCLMGVYLMIILVKDIHYSGKYSEFDFEWRSSPLCSLAGSLCVISTQTSCFLMVILTGYRLYAVYCPFKARMTSATPWIIAAVSSWIISIIIAVVSNTTRYFKSKVLFVNNFSSSDTVTHDYVTDFACRLAILTNTSQDLDDSSWESVQSFLKDKFPQYVPIGEIGYYGTTSVCMPRLYVDRSDTFWIYSIVMITFNFFSFMFVLSGFALIAWKLKNRPIQSDNSQKQSAKMNQRICRIIISDFLCWIPICTMAYISVSGVKLPNGVEIFTAGVLLPINSAFNPMLYSPYIENKAKRLCKRFRPSRNHTPNRKSIELNVNCKH
ncbi:unnamed protein product [Clavelina lepadiformis]|uniref:G-protein coupled receptors family 1 profile domain-containing protein n=1 Tax=Clavelina lepadiformis TaxID=159417 RepID=A0ABP0G1I3_CLALP